MMYYIRAAYSDYSMKELSRKIFDASRLILALLLLGALAGAVGGSSAERLMAVIETADAGDRIAVAAHLRAAADDDPAGDPAAGNMTPGQRRQMPVSQSQLAAVMVPQVQTETRVRADARPEAVSQAERPAPPVVTAARSTVAESSPETGRRFTLVGSRPSGTS